MVSAKGVHFDEQTNRNIEAWLSGSYDKETKLELRKMIEERPEEVIDAFYKNLEFGTGGLRGIMGIGSNRVNQYTIMTATQALANHIATQEIKDRPSVFITYDSRNNSKYFATVTARVLAANGIKAYIFNELRPLCLVSYGCRVKGCTAAVMITASHCLKEYNGYKVFWSDGAQVLPPHDKGIIDEVNQIQDVAEVLLSDSDQDPLIEWVDASFDQEYFQAIKTLQHHPEENAKFGESLRVVYTSLHGAGITMIPNALASWGFTNVSLVEEQSTPDGDFPTVSSPNPEEHAALALGIKQLLRDEADILIGTDPDTDRVGVAVLHQGEAVLITGNQMAALCTAHVCESLEEEGRLPENAAFVKTIVTTELIKVIANKFGKTCEDVLTGFKYIADKIRNWEVDPQGKQFLFGGEESYGYLLGTFVRDKDAVVSSALICEVALREKRKGRTLVDKLHELYKTYGIHLEDLVNIKFPESKEGAEQREALMKKLREESPREIAGIAVESLEDYKTSTITLLKSGEKKTLDFPVSNVLRYWLEDGTKVTVRPSGTEPKVKLYIGVLHPFESDLEKEIKEASNRMKEIASFFQTLL